MAGFLCALFLAILLKHANMHSHLLEEKKIPFKHQLVMIHAGLRGAIAFAMALDFPSQNRPVIINATVWVISFTVFVLGGSCTTVLGK